VAAGCAMAWEFWFGKESLRKSARKNKSLVNTKCTISGD
jgi:hypothetical protein